MINKIITQMKPKEKKALLEALEKLKQSYIKQNEELTKLFLEPNLRILRAIELLKKGKIGSVQYSQIIQKENKRREEVFKLFNLV